MSYLWVAGLAEDYCNNIEAEGSVLDVVSCQKVAGGSCQFGFFGSGDDGFGGREAFIGSGLYLNKDNRAIGVDHNEVEFTGFAGEVAGELFKAF